MSILIPGMNMPKFGERIVITSDGVASKYLDGDVAIYYAARPDKEAAAVELPPHGDLIDREKIPFVESENGCQDDYAFRYDINEMNPVIPAEEG